MNSGLKKIIKIDPLKSFTELPIFWGTFISLLLLAIISAILIIINSNLNWKLDYEGFNTFVEIFKVPLSIMALLITFIAILATIHRSAQSKEQLNITNKQNVFSNYYKHIEEFEKYMNSALPTGIFICRNLRLSHSYLFPFANDGNYAVNEDFIKKIKAEFSICRDLLMQFIQNIEYSTHKLIYEVYIRIDNIFSLLNIKIERGGKRLNVDGNMIVVPDHFKGFIYDIMKATSVLIQILAFDHSVSIPDSLIQMTNLNPSVVPDGNILVQDKFDKFDVFANE